MILGTAAALLALALQLPASTGEVRGEVRSEGTGEVITGATVEVLDGRPRAASSDDSGRYRLVGIDPGRRTIRARRVGYAPLEMVVMVPEDQAVELDITLRTTPIVLEPVSVGGRRRGIGTDTAAAGSGDLAMAGARALQSSPGLAEIGLGDALARTPGHHPPDPSDVLFVRGAGADMKLVYLDGAPVYAPFPLGGLLAPFSPELLASADVYLGGAPARYDGGLSYILDLRTRGARTDRPRASGSMDLLSARAMVEVPVGEAVALLLSGRGVHGAGAGWAGDDALPYGYREGLARADIALGDLGDLSVTAFGNGERVWVDSARADHRAVRWGNGSGSARYRTGFGATELEATGAIAEFSARLPVGGTAGRVAEGFSRRVRFALDATSRADAVTLRYGLSHESQRQRFRAGAMRLATESWEPVGSVAEGDETGAYLDAGVRVAPRLLLRAGLRADHFSLNDRVLVAPRASATLLLTDDARVTLAAGRYHQYLRPSDATLLGVSERLPMAAAEPLALARSSHVALALDQDLGEGVRLGLEGFHKSYDGIPGGYAAEARSSGVDLWMRRDSGEWRGWLGYSLAWTWTTPPGRGSEFSGRHLISSGLSAPVGQRARLDLGVVYGAGLPYSAIPLASYDSPEHPLMGDTPLLLNGGGRADAVNAGNAPLISPPSQPYLRVDVGASGTWSPAWGRGGVEFTPYVRLLNTLGHRDALFYRSDDDGGLANPVAILPLVPVVGMEWKF